jgi:hypothetical protein
MKYYGSPATCHSIIVSQESAASFFRVERYISPGKMIRLEETGKRRGGGFNGGFGIDK